MTGLVNGLTLFVIGGGGHAMVVTEAARAQGWRVLGFFDDDLGASIDDRAPRLGALAELTAPEQGEGADAEIPRAIIALGSLEVRARLIAELRGLYGVVIHPSAVVSPSATIGAGAFIGAQAVAQSRAKVGEHAIVNTGAVVEHDCVVGSNAHIGPGAVLGGGVSVGSGALIGLGARVRPGIRVGRGCVVGAGAVVVKHVPDETTVVGVPARPAEWWGRLDGG